MKFAKSLIYVSALVALILGLAVLFDRENKARQPNPNCPCNPCKCADPCPCCKEVLPQITGGGKGCIALPPQK